MKIAWLSDFVRGCLVAVGGLYFLYSSTLDVLRDLIASSTEFKCLPLSRSSYSDESIKEMAPTVVSVFRTSTAAQIDEHTIRHSTSLPACP